MSEVFRQIHITPARKEKFNEVVKETGRFLAREFLQEVLGDVKYRFSDADDGSTRFLLKQPLSEERETRLREIWELTMPPAPHADRMRREEFG